MSARRSRPRHSVTVSIAGEKHVLRSDAPPEYTRAVAAHVDRTVTALGDKQPLQPHRAAILAALFITDELFRARKELAELREAMDGRAHALTERLEGAVRAAVPDLGAESVEGGDEDGNDPTDGGTDADPEPSGEGSAAGGS